MNPQPTGDVETDDEREARILAEAKEKVNREELAKKGVFATEEFIDAAIKWGREPMVDTDLTAGR